MPQQASMIGRLEKQKGMTHPQLAAACARAAGRQVLRSCCQLQGMELQRSCPLQALGLPRSCHLPLQELLGSCLL